MTLPTTLPLNSIQQLIIEKLDSAGFIYHPEHALSPERNAKNYRNFIYQGKCISLNELEELSFNETQNVAIKNIAFANMAFALTKQEPEATKTKESLLDEMQCCISHSTNSPMLMNEHGFSYSIEGMTRLIKMAELKKEQVITDPNTRQRIEFLTANTPLAIIAEEGLQKSSDSSAVVGNSAVAEDAAVMKDLTLLFQKPLPVDPLAPVQKSSPVDPSPAPEVVWSELSWEEGKARLRTEKNSKLTVELMDVVMVFSQENAKLFEKNGEFMDVIMGFAPGELMREIDELSRENSKLNNENKEFACYNEVIRRRIVGKDAVIKTIARRDGKLVCENNEKDIVIEKLSNITIEENKGKEKANQAITENEKGASFPLVHADIASSSLANPRKRPTRLFRDELNSEKDKSNDKPSSAPWRNKTGSSSPHSPQSFVEAEINKSSHSGFSKCFGK